MFSQRRGRRSNIRSDVSMQDASDAQSQLSASLTTFQVTGWTQSKASSNPDGGVANLLEFLEKKASQPKRAPLKIIQSAREGESLLISVRTPAAQRFAHLDGFQFAGVRLGVTEITRGSQSVSFPSQPTSSAPFGQSSKPSRPSQTAPANGTCFPASVTAQPSGQAAKVSTSIPIQAARFRDEADIGANFVTTFFPLFDTDRRLALQNFYDSDSTFSLSVNTHANRLETLEKLDPSWSAYIKRSRNLIKITHLPARMSRSHRGQEHIFKEWSELPSTRHPPFDQNNTSNWLIECHSLPGLPDPTGAAAGGVGGLIVMVHGSFEELNASNGQVTSRRSFDRTFIIGPGAGLGGIRVISDIISLRAYGGSEGLAIGPPDAPQQPQPPTQPQLPNPPQLPQQSQVPAHPEIQPGTAYEGFGMPAPGKLDEQVIKETRALELSFKTRLPLEAAGQILAGNSWDVDSAFANFQSLLQGGQIPEGALLQ